MIENSESLKFLVLGGDGQVGLSLCQFLSSRQIPYQSLTITESADASGLTSFIEQSTEYPFIVNALFEEPPEGDLPLSSHWLEQARLIASLARQTEKVLFQLSSGLVFSGKSNRGYVETDQPDSQSSMGKLYQDIESSTFEIWPNTLILRASWLFSEQVNNFLTQLVGAAISQETLRVSGNLRGCPTDAHAVARVLVAMAEQVDCNVSEPDLWGTYHYADSDACSMHTFAKTVITVVKSMAEVRVENLEEGDTPSMVDAVVETENYELICKKILSTFGIKQRPWRRSVHEVLKGKFSSQS